MTYGFKFDDSILMCPIQEILIFILETTEETK